MSHDAAFRRAIRNMIVDVRSRSHGTMLTLFEQITGTTNITAVDADEFTKMLMSGDPTTAAHKAIAQFHDPQNTADRGITDAVTTKDGARQLRDWVKSLGQTNFTKRLKYIQNALPSSGTPKSKMPALEPDDVNFVEDALSPGGTYNIDIVNPFAGGEDDVVKYHDARAKMQKAEARVRVLENKFPDQFRSGMPGGSKKNPRDLALTFLTKGKYDDENDDDKIEVLKDEPIVVRDMVPTQKNVYIGKAMAFALAGGFDKKQLGAYVTQDNEILDGHHRWAGTLIVNPNAVIYGHKVMAPSSEVLPILTALGNALGNQQKGSDDD